jgi:hypothetical protein
LHTSISALFHSSIYARRYRPAYVLCLACHNEEKMHNNVV